MNPQKIQDPGTAIKFLGAICLGKMYIVPEALTDNVQTHPTPKNMKGIQVFIGIWGFWRFLLPTWHSAAIPILPGKERACMGHGSEQQATFEKAKVLMKQIKALGISQAGLPFDLDVSVILEGVS